MEQFGWREGRNPRGSHVIMVKAGFRPVPVPNYRQVEPNLLRDIVRQAGIARQEFLDAIP